MKDISKFELEFYNSSSLTTKIQVTVHPLVLLSVVDHYKRVAHGTRKRVVGVLLGEVIRENVDVTNSFAIPFEEDSRNPAIFYLDHSYLEIMLSMFRKINAKERVVGFYSTGPEIRPNDSRIYSLMKRFLPELTVTPLVLVIIDVRSDQTAVPTTAYCLMEVLDENYVRSSNIYTIVNEANTTSSNKMLSPQMTQTFSHIPCQIGAIEAEEVGVEHLLREINDPTIPTLTNLLESTDSSMGSLASKLITLKNYCETTVENPKAIVNQEIIRNMQEILNILPNLNVEEFLQSLLIQNNDTHMIIYLSSLIRTVIALHDLINNKIRYNEAMNPKNTSTKKENTKQGKQAPKSHN